MALCVCRFALINTDWEYTEQTREMEGEWVNIDIDIYDIDDVLRKYTQKYIPYMCIYGTNQQCAS